MFPSTPPSNSTLKGLVGADGLVENNPVLSTYLARSKFSLAERIQKRINRLHGKDENDSPSKGKHAAGRPSPSKFGRERMVRARSGRFRKPSLEAACLSAQGGDAVTTCQVPGSWEESSSLDCSSVSDAEHLNFKSSQTVSSDVNLESTPSRSSCPLLFDPRGCGYIHSASRSLAHKIIEEEMSKIETPASANTLLQVDLPEVSLLDAEADNSRKRPFQEYYALKVEAETILVESKKQWIDTPFSASVVQDFRPLYDAEMIQSILQESLKNYKPLPSELRHRHRSSSRISCRMSPYANSRMSKLTSSKEIPACSSPSIKRKHNMVIPKETSLLDVFTNRNSKSMPALAAKPLIPSDIVDKANAHEETSKCASPLTMKAILRPPLPIESPLKSESAAPKTPVTKRANNKENLHQEAPKTPGGSLKVDRPRPRYRTPTPGRKRRPAKEQQNVNMKYS